MTADNRNLITWLSCVCAVIYLMIVVGGVTRLTQSGLSMVDWRPIMGVIPPLTLIEWEQAFEAYKQYPEFQKINRDMDLEQFKGIFYWEFGHRLLGRIIGLVYFIPFVIFLALGRIEKKWKPQLWIAFVLGGLQGLMGWYMVKSGLVDIPHVSHFRLAAHLLLAILILVVLFWLILDLLGVKRIQVSGRVQKASVFVLLLLTLQLLLGAFTAGLDAGHGFNTYPLMHGQWLADAAVMIEPLLAELYRKRCDDTVYAPMARCTFVNRCDRSSVCDSQEWHAVTGHGVGWHYCNTVRAWGSHVDAARPGGTRKPASGGSLFDGSCTCLSGLCEP